VRSRLPAVVLFLVAALALAAVALASSGSSSPPGQVVYSAATPSLGVESRSLFTARLDGTGSSQLTSGSSQDFDPRWSPSGTQIAFTRFDDQDTALIGGWVINSDGTGLHRLDGVPSLEAAKWSPDGRWIAFQQQTAVESDGSEANQSFDLWIVHPDGSGLRKVAQGGASEDGSDLVSNGTGWAWSPDSAHLSVRVPRSPGAVAFSRRDRQRRHGHEAGRWTRKLLGLVT
jgi:Tol biopolymer transport system component